MKLHLPLSIRRTLLRSLDYVLPAALTLPLVTLSAVSIFEMLPEQLNDDECRAALLNNGPADAGTTFSNAPTSVADAPARTLRTLGYSAPHVFANMFAIETARPAAMGSDTTALQPTASHATAETGSLRLTTTSVSDAGSALSTAFSATQPEPSGVLYSVAAAPVSLSPAAANPVEQAETPLTASVSPDGTAEAAGETPGLTWVGDSGGYWDSGVRNWRAEDGSTTVFAAGDSALFDASGHRDVNIATGQTVTDMTITAAGYTFSGGGNISVSGTLDINMAEVEGTGYENPATLSFGQANNITAGSMLLRSGAGTQATFGGSVAAGSLTIDNCAYHGAKAGAYIFLNGVSVSGAANITLGSDSGASAKELLSVTGDFSAASLSLDGTARKHFNNAVTTTGGDLIISGHAGTAATLTDGLTTFNGAVTIAEGHQLILRNNTEATFNSTLESAAGAGMLQTELNRGILRINTFLSSMSSGTAYDLGTITLTGQGGLTFGARTVAEADIIGNGQNLIIGGSAARADITLTNDGSSGGTIGNITINGGTVQLFARTDDAGTQLGNIGGKLTVSNGAAVTMGTDNLFAATAGGLQVEQGAKVLLGNTTQTVYGGISLKDGGSITGNAGSTLVIPAGVTNATLHYSGHNNQLGSTIVQGANNTLTFLAGESGSELTLIGDITGSGALAFSGSGTTVINTDLSHTGSVSVSGGTRLELGDNNSLAKADSLTVADGGTLAIPHFGSSVQLTGDLTLGDDATLLFHDLTTGKSAVNITGGGMYFNTSAGKDVTIAFDNSLSNFTTYTLVTSDTSINFASGAEAGGVVVTINGEHVESGQYEFGFYREGNKVGDTRYLYFTTMFGRQWKNAAGGTWNDAEDITTSEYWKGGMNHHNALLREQAGTSSVSISLSDTSATEHVYMDGRTNYTLSGNGTGFAEGAELTKRGAANSTDTLSDTQGILTWQNVHSSAMGMVRIEGGELRLTNNSLLGVKEGCSIDIAAPGIVNGIAMVGKLSVDASSALLLVSDATASIKGSTGKTAELSALHMEGRKITGSAQQGYISNAAITGAEMEQLQLQGTGSINGGSMGSGMSFAAGSSYSLSGSITLDATAANEGTLSFDSNVELGIGALAGEIGANTTYTLFTGGSYTNWKSLSAINFSIHGVNLDTVKDSKGNKGQVTTTVTENGKVTLTSDNVTFVNWDPNWEIGENYLPILAFDTVKKPNKEFDVTTGNQGAWSFVYHNRVDTAPNNIYVANVKPDYGISSLGAYGDIDGTSSAQGFVHSWLNANTSVYDAYAGGSNGNSTFYGISHLQITGDAENANLIIGGSENAAQYGNSYLTITAGDYTDAGLNGKAPIVAGGNYNRSGSAADTVHYGDSYLHITGGTFGSVYGGSYETTTRSASFNFVEEGTSTLTTVEGLTHVLIDGGTVDTIYGGDFTSEESTHTGNVVIDIKGGTVKNVYAAGSPDGTNLNRLAGNATVNIYAIDGEMDSSHFAEDGVLYGGNNHLTDATLYSSTLNFKDADSLYDLRSLNVQRFGSYNLANNAHVIVQADGFNVTNDLVVSGAGIVEVLADNENKNTTAHLVSLANGATLHLNTSHYQSSGSATPSTITVAAGTAVDASYTFKEGDQNAMNIHLVLEDTGTNGEGALFKNSGTAMAKGTSFPQISLAGDASMVLDGGTSLYMIQHRLQNDGTDDAVYEGTALDLRNGAPQARGHTLTLSGGGTLGLYNTDIQGGTLNVVDGTVQSNMSSNAGNTDIILRSGATLELTNTDDGTGYFGDEPGTDTAAAYNGLGIESLNGSGTVNLGNKGWLYINTDQGHDGFAEGVDSTGLESYAHFSGSFAASGGKVTKAGEGNQYFSGSNSLYSGGTSLMGGKLYAEAGSSAAVFRKELGASVGDTQVDAALGGVFGTGDLTWEGGALYLAQGVNIYNNGSAADGKDIIFGVESHVAEDGTTTYDVATYSGVLSGGSDSKLLKEGGGTLILTQDGTFSSSVRVQEGSLNLRRWVDADDYADITVDDGASLVFTYDNSGRSPEGVLNEISKVSTGITISGSGDPRWTSLASGTRTAALCSGIASGKELELAGTIQDGASFGNLLHSGEGTLTLSGANTYSGGTTLDGGDSYNNGTIIVAHDTGLGSTAAGGHANLVTEEASSIIFAEGVSTTLAATKDEEYAGNDIRGRVVLEADATLTMKGSGYYAARTELESDSTLIFHSGTSSNWNGAANTEDKEEMGGAGILAGSRGAVVAVSDAAASASGAGARVCFRVTDTPANATELNDDATGTAASSGYAGDLVVEGQNTLLHIQGGELAGGNYKVSGNGARLDAKRSVIMVENGQNIELTSQGDADADADSTATLAAYRVEITQGGRLAATRGETDFLFAEQELEKATQFELTAALHGYTSAQENQYHFAANYNNGYEHRFDSTVAINVQTATTLETESGLTMHAGSIYEVFDTNTSLTGTPLTFNVTETEKIILRGGAAFEQYMETLEAAGNSATSTTMQWVLFSDVGAFHAVMDSKTLVSGTALAGEGLNNQLYVTRASDLVVAGDEAGNLTVLPENILLIYDAGAQVLYLDRKPNLYPEAVPEPTTATLSLLALALLTAHRRRK